jgi:hypothetical protein
MCGEIGFAREAKLQGIVPRVLFILDNDTASARGYALLRRLFPKTALIAVNNENVLYGEMPSYLAPGRTFDIGVLPDFLKGYIGKTGFSFAHFAQNKANKSSELYDWIRNIFLHFREIEVQLMLG